MEFETVIGLEVHVELATKTKIFCNCSTEFGAPPNTHTCPVCLGQPGVLPVLNEEALHYAIKAALALNCEITRETKFDRKNYFYPDLPKAYQISQYDKPVGRNGWIDIEVNGATKRIRINRLHLEEDAGKLTHLAGEEVSLIDFNRVGVPLIEIVSEPDISSPEEAVQYLEKLKAIMQYIEVSDVKMEQGSLRCDANISLRKKGDTKLGTKTELKNMNTFKGILKGLEFEEKRQAAILNNNGVIKQETRRWDENIGETIAMRGKEEAHDYRYFPDPDLPVVEINDELIAKIKGAIPELPADKEARYIKEYGLSSYDANVLTSSKKLADFFEEALLTTKDIKSVANWVMGDILGYLNATGSTIEQLKVTGKELGKLVELINNGTISIKIGKTVLKEMIETGKEAELIVQEKGLVQISDTSQLEEIVQKVIAQNPQSVADYLQGKERALGFLVGQIMKETKGKANPQVVNELLKKNLK